MKWGHWSLTTIGHMAESNQISGLSSGNSINCGTTNCTVPTIVDSPCETISYLVHLVKAAESISYMALALEDGSNYAVTRVMATGELYISVTDAQNTLGQGNEWTDYGIDQATGCYNVSDNRGSYGTYDPRIRPWYIAAKRDRQKGWGGGVFQESYYGNLVISA